MIRPARPVRRPALDRPVGLLLAALFALGAGACSSGSRGAPRDPLQSLPLRATPLPDEPDLAARDLAAAALAGDADGARAEWKRLEAVERLHQAAGAEPSGLPAYGQHLGDATLDDAIARRRASAALPPRPCSASSSWRWRTTRWRWRRPASARRAASA